jgi:hypothetical protein
MSNYFGKLNASMPMNKGIPYTDPDGTEFHAPRVPELLQLVMVHRMTNGGDLSVGWQDVVGNEICEASNLPCCSDHVEQKKRKLNIHDIKVFMATVYKWNRSVEGFATDEEANRRAKICSTCPHNTEIEGCSACYRLLNKVKQVLGDKTTDYDASLKGCEVCACSLAAKVWLPKEVIAGTRDANQWPSDHPCWMKED